MRQQGESVHKDDLCVSEHPQAELLKDDFVLFFSFFFLFFSFFFFYFFRDSNERMKPPIFNPLLPFLCQIQIDIRR